MLHSYLFAMFVENESNRLPDIALSAFVAIRFPSAVIPPKKRLSRIPVWRSKYNCGDYGVPPVLSLKYLDGVPVNKNNHPLSAKEIEALQQKFLSRFKEETHASSVT